jgi:hypothetical protein
LRTVATPVRINFRVVVVTLPRMKTVRRTDPSSLISEPPLLGSAYHPYQCAHGAERVTDVNDAAKPARRLFAVVVGPWSAGHDDGSAVQAGKTTGFYVQAVNSSAHGHFPCLATSNV